MPDDLPPEAQAAQPPANAPPQPVAAELGLQDARALAMQAQQRFVQASHFGMQVQVGPAPNELLAKLEPEHITTLI